MGESIFVLVSMTASTHRLALHSDGTFAEGFVFIGNVTFGEFTFSQAFSKFLCPSVTFEVVDLS